MAKEWGDWRYKIQDNGTAEIERYMGNDENVKVPETIEGISVIAIGCFAFCIFKNIASVLKRLEVPASVVQIRPDAFNDAEFGEICCLRGSVMDLYASMYNMPVTYTGQMEKDPLDEYEIFEDDWEFFYCDDWRSLYKIDGTKWETDNKDRTIVVSYTGTDSFVVVPAQIGGMPVTGFARYAFQNLRDLVYVRLPESVRSLDEPDDFIYFENPVNGWHDAVFYRCNNLRRVDARGIEGELSDEWLEECRTIDLQKNKLWFEARCGSEIENVRFYANGHMLRFQIFTYLGDSFGDLICCVKNLQQGGEGSVIWCAEPGKSIWKLHRDHQGLLFYDIDGFIGEAPYDVFLNALEQKRNIRY